MSLKTLQNSANTTLLFTDTAGGYRDETSPNTSIDAELWQALVPQSGRASTVHGSYYAARVVSTETLIKMVAVILLNSKMMAIAATTAVFTIKTKMSVAIMKASAMVAG